MSEPTDKDQAPSDVLAQLQARLSRLEETVGRITVFDQTVTEALSHMLDRFMAFEPLIPWSKRADYRFESQLSLHNLAHVSKIYPKTRSVVFVGKSYFGDNVKYAYLAFCDYARGRDISVHYLTEDAHQLEFLKAHGLPCISAEPELWTAEDVKLLLSAKVLILNDNFHPFSFQSPKAFGMLQGAKSIQLWHGIPIKEVGLRYLMRADNVVLDELLASCGPYDVFVAPGQLDREAWAKMFVFREFAALGYPRTDIFFRTPSPMDLLNVDLDTLRLFEQARRVGTPTILYAPTFRDDAYSDWFDKAGIDKLANHAQARNYLFAVNLHPFEQNKIEELRARYPGIRFVARGTDIYPIIAQSDMLITGYSSLGFDYLLLERPLVFYRPDSGDYAKFSRGMIEGREAMTPGSVAHNVDELIRAVDNNVEFVRSPDADPFRTARRDLRRRLIDHTDGKAAQRVCELIAKYIDSD